MLAAVLMALSVLSIASYADAVSCLDENLNEVGWWVILKKNAGLEYSYMDADSSSAKMPRVNGVTLDTYKNSLGGTLQQIIDQRSTLGVMMWNDEVPPPFALLNATANLTSGTSGHTKGVIAGDANGGFWLTHSMPLFPVLDQAHFSWTPSVTYAQAFLCVSLKTADDIEAAAQQISYVDPLVYDSAVPSALKSTLPTLAAVIDGTRTAGTSYKTFSSALTNTQFTHFGKSGSTDMDLMEDVVQAHYQLDFMWETWRRSPVMETYCRPQYPYDSINVNDLQWIGADGSPYHFKYTQDHSKWGVAINGTSQQHYVCIGDNNRMTSQWKRGGGTVCFRQAAIYTPVLGSIAGADTC